MHTQTLRDVAQSLPIHREESAQQAAVAEFLDPTPPAFGVASQPFQDSRHLGRDRGLAVAEQPAREVDQKQVTPHLLKRVTGLGRLRVRGQKSVFMSIYLKVAGWNVLRAAAARSVIEKLKKFDKTASFAQSAAFLTG